MAGAFGLGAGQYRDSHLGDPAALEIALDSHPTPRPFCAFPKAHKPPAAAPNKRGTSTEPAASGESVVRDHPKERASGEGESREAQVFSSDLAYCS